MGTSPNYYDAEGASVPDRTTSSGYQPVIIRESRAVEPYDDQINYAAEEQQRLQLAAIWGAFLKHRWLICATIAVAILLGIGATLLMQPLYTATTTLQIDRESSKVLDVQDVVPAEALTGNEFFDTQVGLLKSETLARRVVQELNLTADPKFRDMVGVGDQPIDPATAGAMETAFAQTLMGYTDIKQQGLSRLVKVSFTSPDPELSARIANALATNFQATTLERRYDSSSFARKFLERQLSEFKRRLEESEKQLVAYGGEQQIINVSPQSSTGGNSDSASQSLTALNLSALNSTLAEAQGERIRAEQRWRQAQSTAILSLPEVLSDQTAQALRQQRATLSATYQERLRIYRPDFPEMLQLRAQMDEVDRQLNAVAGSILASIRSRYEIALRQEQSLGSRVEGLKGDFNDLRQRNIQYTILQREVDTNRTLYEGLLQRYKEVGVAGGLGSNNVAVVDRAIPPGGPSSPNLILNLAIALGLGLAVAAGLTLLLELLDESIRTPDDVQTKLRLTLVGAIPALAKGVTPADGLADPRSPFSEAYSSARTSLQFATSDGLPSSLFVTSSRPAEGKSTSSMAIAKSLAQLGMRVLLVDSDLRNPSVHRLMSVDNTQGLSNYLTGQDIDSLVQASSDPGLFVLPCGPLPLNPVELLAGPRLMQLFHDAQQRFDIMVIDGPPVIGLADAPILSSRAAASLLVVESGGARRSVVRIATRRLLQARGKLIGVLLTKFNAASSGYGYGYGYSYAYSYEYGQRRLDKGAT